MSEGYFPTRIAGALLALLCVVPSVIALASGRFADLGYAALMGMPLATLAALLYAAPIAAFIAEGVMVLVLPAVGAYTGGPFIGIAVGVGIMGIAYWPRWPGFESRHRVGLSLIITALVIAAHVSAGAINPPTGGDDAFTLVLNLGWLLPALFVCVGWPQRRSLGAALARLGLVWPDRRTLLSAVALGLVLVPAMLALSTMTDAIFKSAGWATTSSDDVRQVFAGLMTPVGIGVIALTAGVGEEIMVRGVLQPRFGLVLPALFFTALHAGQYQLAALLPLLCLSLALGAARRRWHTTACVVAHVVYDLGIGWALIA